MSESLKTDGTFVNDLPVEQNRILNKNMWLYGLDHDPVSPTEQQVARQFTHYSMITWLASLVLDTRVLQFIHCDIVSTVRNIDYTPSCRKALAITAILVVTLMTSMEVTYICQISGNIQVLGCMMFSMMAKLLRTLAQGHVFVYGTITPAQTCTQRFSYLMTCLANVAIPLVNALTIYTYWTPVYTIYVLAPLLFFDVFYRIALLFWYIDHIRGMAPENNPQNTVHNNIVPPEHNQNHLEHGVSEIYENAVEETAELDNRRAIQGQETPVYIAHNKKGFISLNVNVESPPMPTCT